MAHRFKLLRVPFGVGQLYAVTGTGRLDGGFGCLTYLSCYETTGTAAATLSLYDGTTNDGLLITAYTLAQGQSTSESWVPHALAYEHGLYIAATGSVAGSLTALGEHHCLSWLALAHRAEGDVALVFEGG